MSRKEFYETPDSRVSAFRFRVVLCMSQGQSSTEGITEDEEGNDYD